MHAVLRISISPSLSCHVAIAGYRHHPRQLLITRVILIIILAVTVLGLRITVWQGSLRQSYPYTQRHTSARHSTAVELRSLCSDPPLHCILALLASSSAPPPPGLQGCAQATHIPSTRFLRLLIFSNSALAPFSPSSRESSQPRFCLCQCSHLCRYCVLSTPSCAHFVSSIREPSISQGDQALEDRRPAPIVTVTTVAELPLGHY